MDHGRNDSHDMKDQFSLMSICVVFVVLFTRVSDVKHQYSPYVLFYVLVTLQLFATQYNKLLKLQL